MANNIYVEIDTIFDTRLTVVGMIDSKLGIDILKGNYFRRFKDEFKYLSLDVFNMIYKQRTKEILAASKITPILEMVREFIEEASVNDVLQDGNGEVTLYVNIYPYKLSEAEIREMQLSLLPYFSGVHDILIMSYENISPKWIHDNITMSIMYDGINWINRNTCSGELIQYPIHDGLLVVPKLLHAYGTVDDKTFEQHENLMGPIVNIKFLEINHFSILKEK